MTASAPRLQQEPNLGFHANPQPVVAPKFCAECGERLVVTRSAFLVCPRGYRRLLNVGWSPQQARSVLPNSLKTEIVCTANLREWRHVFSLRCASAAHPQMREVMQPLRAAMATAIPVIFDDLAEHGK